MARPRVLAILPGFIPSTVITVVKPLLKLHQTARINLDISREFLVQRRNLEWADVVVFCRNTRPKYGQFLDWAIELNKPIIYDLDDNLLEAPDSVPESNCRYPEIRAELERYLRRSDLVRVYSATLREYLMAYNQNVERVDGPLDWSLIPDDPPVRDAEQVRIVYATSRFEDQIGLMLVDDISQVLNKFPQAEFVVWGPRFKPLVGHPRVRHIPPIFDYDMFLYSFARRGFDIGLAPLPNDLFHRCKSNNKFREYAACGIAGIYSDTEVYRECVIEEMTGLLAGEHKGAWFEAISRLIEDKPLREYIQHRARVYAQKRYSMEKMQSDWITHIDRVLLKTQPGTEPAVTVADFEKPTPQRAPFGALFAVAFIGALSQIIHFGQRAVSSLKNRDSHVTMSKLKVHLTSIYQLIILKIRLWRSPFNPRN